jgi:ATP-dependent Clp protease, protease subunit
MTQRTLDDPILFVTPDLDDADDEAAEEKSKEKDKSSEDPGMMTKVLASRTVILSGQVNAELAQRAIQQLVLLDHESDKRITLLINSPGGEVYSGFAIFDTLRFIGAPIVSVVVGLAASMGSILALAAPKGSRFCTPNGKFLIHQPLMMGYQGRAVDIEIQAKEIIRDRERLVELYSQETGKPPAEIAKDIDRDRWMTAEEAKAYGLVDRIISTRKELQKA